MAINADSAVNKASRIYVAGHRGMVGSGIVRQLQAAGYDNILVARSDSLNLTRQSEVDDFFSREKPDAVILAAAKVGGIHANNTYPAEFIHDNLMMQCNVVDAAHRHGAQRLLFLGSSCIYPRMADQPIKEEALGTGALELTNEPYAVAKIAGIKLCESYQRQYSFDCRSIMPTNLYGPGDNFHPENSHVIPALMQRIHNAAQQQAAEVVIWGSGTPMREFLHVDDMAAASVHVLLAPRKDYDALTEPQMSHINVGTGVDVTIAELARTLADVIGFKGKLVFDAEKPDGTPRKLLDVSKIKQLGWQPQVELGSGLEATYHWFQQTLDAGKIRA